MVNMLKIVLHAYQLQIILIFFLKCVGNSVQKDFTPILQVINVKFVPYSSVVKHAFMMQQILNLTVPPASMEHFSIYQADNAFLLVFQRNIKTNGTIAVVIAIHHA